LRVALIEPFYTGSHRRWAEDYRDFSGHQVDLYTAPGRHWKWRMHEAALSLAEEFCASGKSYDQIIVSDMLDLSTFKSFIGPQGQTSFVIYFHENQLTYPWSAQDRDRDRGGDRHYAWINYVSALAADEVWFNSDFHRTSFLEALRPFLKAYPDRRGMRRIEPLAQKSRTVSLKLNLSRLDEYDPIYRGEEPLILWNHRWEYDKNPRAFFKALFQLSEEGIPFQLAVLGTRMARWPVIFDEAKEHLSEHIVQWGPVDRFRDYASWLHAADILPVTSKQDFFGISAVEAMYCNVVPLLPNRLAFPEHVPDARYLYDSDEELFDRLHTWLTEPTKKPAPARERVLRYSY
jgi:glycosyltransferase involved in cell wall biosynthesis